MRGTFPIFPTDPKPYIYLCDYVDQYWLPTGSWSINTPEQAKFYYSRSTKFYTGGSAYASQQTRQDVLENNSYDEETRRVITPVPTSCVVRINSPYVPVNSATLYRYILRLTPQNPPSSKVPISSGGWEKPKCRDENSRPILWPPNKPSPGKKGRTYLCNPIGWVSGNCNCPDGIFTGPCGCSQPYFPGDDPKQICSQSCDGAKRLANLSISRLSSSISNILAENPPAKLQTIFQNNKLMLVKINDRNNNIFLNNKKQGINTKKLDTFKELLCREPGVAVVNSTILWRIPKL